MENPCKILCFGDSITHGYAPFFENKIKKEYSDYNLEIINAGVAGETTRDGLNRINKILFKEKPQVVIIGFGMNDWGRSVTTLEFARNLSTMIASCEKLGARVLLVTINPVKGIAGDSGNSRIDAYNQVIKDVAWESRIRIVDVNSLWKQKLKPFQKGLRDNFHPNNTGNEIYCNALIRTVPRRNTIILWQYNGNPAQCNYSCPYCSYDQGSLQIGHHFQGAIESWHETLKKTFGRQHLVFYFGHGEPMLGKRWFDVVEMIGNEPNWEMRVISNISPPLKKLLNSKVAKEGRLNINASFHPTQTTKAKFLKKLLQCREYGIEVPIVYTLWPPFFKRFEDDFRVFDENNFLIHVRRFKGVYNGKSYPEEYTEEERRFIAKYADDTTIKYMLSNEPTDGKPTWTSVDFMIMDNKGNVGYCDDYPTSMFTFGNVFSGNVRLNIEPKAFPIANVSDGTVDGVSNIVEIGMKQLEGNHIYHFARQGGVYLTENGVYYKNMFTNFDDPSVRAEYYFPPRNLTDCYYIATCNQRNWFSKWDDISNKIFPSPIARRVSTKSVHKKWSFLRNHLPGLRKTSIISKNMMIT